MLIQWPWPAKGMISLEPALDNLAKIPIGPAGFACVSIMKYQPVEGPARSDRAVFSNPIDGACERVELTPNPQGVARHDFELRAGA
jgi:hypothetical protein